MKTKRAKTKRVTKRVVTLVWGVLLAGSACTHRQPNVIYMPDMVYSPAIKAQEAGAMQPPVAGTVSRDFVRPEFGSNPDTYGRDLKNPLPRTAAILSRGQAAFGSYCLPCHGPTGEGDGTIVPRFPRPPSLQSDKIRGWADGQIFHIVTQGRNLMPSYASQITTGDRWAIAHYIRALHRAKKPTTDDLKKADQ